MNVLRPALLLSLSLAVTASATSQDWPNWRGPRHDGSSSVEGLPTDFDTEKRVLWQLPLPGPGASTPIVVGDHVFLSSTDLEANQLIALCIDRHSGNIVWRREAGSGYTTTEGGHKLAGGQRSNYASPSPTCDGSRVVFFFGNGDLVAYDLEGGELWRHQIQEEFGDFAFQWTFSASPTLFEHKVYLPVLQRDEPVGPRRRPRTAEEEELVGQIESFVLCFDAESGKLDWRHVRPSDARKESLESYTTIIPNVRNDGSHELLLVGGDVITGHDPATGAEQWRWGTWNEGHRELWWRIVPSPVVHGGVVLVCAPKKAPVYAIELGGRGMLDASALRWKSKGRRDPVASDVPTPAAADGAFFVLGDKHNVLSRVRASDGETIWSTKIDTKGSLLRASPTVADGKVWIISHAGEVFIVDADTGKLLRSVPMADDQDQIRSSLAVAHGALYIRTADRLFCIGAAKER